MTGSARSSHTTTEPAADQAAVQQAALTHAPSPCSWDLRQARCGSTRALDGQVGPKSRRRRGGPAAWRRRIPRHRGATACGQRCTLGLLCAAGSCQLLHPWHRPTIFMQFAVQAMSLLRGACWTQHQQRPWQQVQAPGCLCTMQHGQATKQWCACFSMQRQLQAWQQLGKAAGCLCMLQLVAAMSQRCACCSRRLRKLRR